MIPCTNKLAEKKSRCVRKECGEEKRSGLEHAKSEESVGYKVEVDSRSTQGSKSGSQLRTTDENIALIHIREPVQPLLLALLLLTLLLLSCEEIQPACDLLFDS